MEALNTVLTVPELSLVLLVGASGSGKSTFAARHFGAFEVLSSDHYRGVVSNDTHDQSASGDAFDVLEHVARKRLERGLLTVIDATNVDPSYRKRWVRLAREHHVLPVAIVLDLPPATCHARNADRPDREFGRHVVRQQSGRLRRGLRGLRREGFRYIHVLKTAEEVDAATVDRPRPWTDRRDDHGPFDIIGDVHGCYDELVALLAKLGYAREDEGFRTPSGRRALFLGDLVDRGPASNHVLRLVMDMVEAGAALCVPGNHEIKLLRHLRGKNVKLTHGLDKTVEQLATEDDAFRERVARFIDGLVSHYVLDGGRLIVAHAGMREDLAGRASGRVRQFALFGETTGETDEYGLPVRYAWARDYKGRAAVVYGHTPVPSAEWLNNTICVDTGCVFGGELTALRWPERELVSVPALKTWVEPVRPPQPIAESPGEDGMLHLDDLIGGVVETRFERTVKIHPDNAVPALEALSRFAVDPRWLIHLPPTMSPPETSSRPDLLEHPDEAFAYYAKQGVTRLVCQEKHMGSRALAIVCTDPKAAARRFGFAPEQVPNAGIILTRRGRRFFADEDLEGALLARIRDALTEAGTWDALQTEWVLLDAELMPWSAKARSLLEAQYAPVGAASRHSLGAAVEVLRQTAERAPAAAALLQRYEARHAAAGAYTQAYRRYCWEVGGLDDYKLAPFHLLASEGAVHADKSHRWHLETLGAICDASGGLLTPTAHRFVDLDDEAQVEAATAWWTGLTEAGGEGMVVKPEAFLVREGPRIVQPALKCRGREYLRIIYGPEYTLPDQLPRLKQRATRRKRSLATRELVLGLEALHRFVERQPLHAVHKCVLGILALESEAVDPRL